MTENTPKQEKNHPDAAKSGSHAAEHSAERQTEEKTGPKAGHRSGAHLSCPALTVPPPAAPAAAPRAPAEAQTRIHVQAVRPDPAAASANASADAAGAPDAAAPADAEAKPAQKPRRGRKKTAAARQEPAPADAKPSDAPARQDAGRDAGKDPEPSSLMAVFEFPADAPAQNEAHEEIEAPAASVTAADALVTRDEAAPEPEASAESESGHAQQEDAQTKECASAEPEDGERPLPAQNPQKPKQPGKPEKPKKPEKPVFEKLRAPAKARKSAKGPKNSSKAPEADASQEAQNGAAANAGRRFEPLLVPAAPSGPPSPDSPDAESDAAAAEALQEAEAAFAEKLESLVREEALCTEGSSASAASAAPEPAFSEGARERGFEVLARWQEALECDARADDPAPEAWMLFPRTPERAELFRMTAELERLCASAEAVYEGDPADPRLPRLRDRIEALTHELIDGSAAERRRLEAVLRRLDAWGISGLSKAFPDPAEKPGSRSVPETPTERWLAALERSASASARTASPDAQTAQNALPHPEPLFGAAPAESPEPSVLSERAPAAYCDVRTVPSRGERSRRFSSGFALAGAAAAAGALAVIGFRMLFPQPAFAVIDREAVEARTALLRLIYAEPGRPERPELARLDRFAIDEAIREVTAEKAAGLPVLSAAGLAGGAADPESGRVLDLTHEVLARLGIDAAAERALGQALRLGSLGLPGAEAHSPPLPPAQPAGSAAPSADASSLSDDPGFAARVRAWQQRFLGGVR